VRIQAPFIFFIVLLLLASPAYSQKKNDSTLPQIISVPAPDYPQPAKDAGIGGDVYVLVLISKKGTAKVVDYYGPMAPCSNLDDPLTASVQAAAVEAAKKVTFVPATYNGKPVEKGFELKYFFEPAAKSTSGNTLRSGFDPQATRPVPLRIPKANYPETWGHIAGLVKVRMLIYEDGTVRYAGAMSGNKELRRAAIEAACRATFEPAMRNGVPVRSEFIMVHNFYNYYERG
jgi:outer membrane biosynthesis protein TonB